MESEPAQKSVKEKASAGMMNAYLKWPWKRNKHGIEPDYTFTNFAQLMDLLEKEFGLKRI